MTIINFIVASNERLNKTLIQLVNDYKSSIILEVDGSRVKLNGLLSIMACNLKRKSKARLIIDGEDETKAAKFFEGKI